MATAAELLSDVSNVDRTLVIDNSFRVINIPSSVPNLGVEYDDDVLRLDFRMPRYVSDTDLSAFAIRINYINVKGESDVYTVRDAVVGAQYITFSWLVGPTATRYKGNTQFNVCLKTLTSEGVIDREFNTTIATLPVLAGLEVDEGIVTQYSDLIEQWRQELFGIGDTEEASIKATSQAEQEAIANKGAEVLATIPADYATAISMTDNADRTKADAIICSTQGGTISVSDSSDDYLRGLKVFGKTTQISTTGKNLFNVTAVTKTVSGVTFTINEDGSVTISGTASATIYFELGTFTLPAGEYWLSGTTTGSGTTHLLYFQKTSDNSGYIQCTVADKAFTTTDTDERKMLIAVYSGATVYTTIYPMIRNAAIVDNTYESYSAGVSSPSPEWPQELTSLTDSTTYIYGKNLASNFAGYDQTINGITIKVDQNTSDVLLNGTSTRLFSNSLVRTKMLQPGKYTISVHGLNVHDSGHDRLYVADQTTGKVIVNYIQDGIPKTFELTKTTALRVDMVFKSDTTYSNQTINIQIEHGESVTEYESHKIPQSLVLPHIVSGIPVTSGGNYTDANGQQWVCDEIDFERGVYIQRIKSITLDGVNLAPYYGSHSNGQLYCAFYPGDIANSSRTLSTSYVNPAANWSDEDGFIYCINKSIVITDNRFTSNDAAVSVLAEELPTIQYILATPIETELTAEEIEAFRFAHTNYPNTTILNDAGATMELKYNADTKTWLENLPKATDEQVQAAVDAWLTAHYSSAEGVSF